MKRIVFLAMMMLIIRVNVYSQVRLSSRDTSTVNDANFAVQENGRWRQLPYSVLRDAIYDQEKDKDPLGLIMSDKISRRNGLVPRYFGIADSANIYSKGLSIQRGYFRASYLPTYMANTRLDSSFFRIYGPHGMTQIFGGTTVRYAIGGSKYLSESNYTVNTSAVTASQSYSYKAYGEKVDYTGATYSYFPTVNTLLKRDVLGVGTPDDWEHKTFYADVYSSRDSVYTSSHKANYYQIRTTPNGGENPISQFEITEREGKIWVKSLEGADYVKLENGVLEGKTAVETLNDLGSSAPVYQDNAAAVTAIGTGKVFKDNSGYLRVTQ